jgi:hypothetical protein
LEAGQKVKIATQQVMIAKTWKDIKAQVNNDDSL